MRKGLIVLTLLLCLAAFAVTLTGNVRAQSSVTPGVHIGDDYFYVIHSNWVSSNAYDSIPTQLQTDNQTVSMEVRISDVNDSFVTTFAATYYSNKGPDAGRGTVNVNTGEITDSGYAAIIGGNLNAHQYIHPQTSDGLYINQTVTMNNRPTNEIYRTAYNATDGYQSSDDQFFDQATGILVKEVVTTSDDGSVSGYTSTSSETVELKSSPWDVQTVPTPEFPPILALPIFIGATTLILIALKKKHMIVGTPAVKA
jgi:hypothetical protein